MNNQDSGSFLSLLKEVLRHSSAPEEKLNHFFSLLDQDDYSDVAPEDAAEMSEYLEEAGANLDKMVLESRDIENINNLTDLKQFTNNLLNEAEKNALEFVLSSNSSDSSSQSTSSGKDGKWLLDKLAGLTDDEE
jgi:hypothetical protein